VRVDHPMKEKGTVISESLSHWVASLAACVRVALSSAPEPHDDTDRADTSIDPDFEGWLHGDPSVTKNPASRYGDRTPGYITGNGLGSMEIGAADD